ncbi:DUF2470 domain-containing protein [Streptomyces capparidis]
MPTSRNTTEAVSGREPGQPRPRKEADVRSPTAAERARTLIDGNASAALDVPRGWLTHPEGAVPAARAVLPDGDVLLLVAGASPAVRAAAHARHDELTAVLEVTDVAPVAVPRRVRGRVRVTGWLTPVRPEERAACAMLLSGRYPVGEVLGLPEGALGLDVLDGPGPLGAGSGHDGPRPAWTLLRLEAAEVVVEDLWGTDRVDPEAFAAAEPDPLAAHEADLLQHLAAAHDPQVQSLTALLGDRRGAPGEDAPTAVPLALDRFGLRVRFRGARGALFDVRFEFPEPVDGHDGLRHAMHALFQAAREEQRRQRG